MYTHCSNTGKQCYNSGQLNLTTNMQKIKLCFDNAVTDAVFDNVALA